MIAALLLASSLAVPSRAQAPAIPQQPQIINLSLLEALVTIQAQDMAGVFGFIAEQNAPPAMADYLLHHKKGLKLYLKRVEKDLKDAGGINEWDQLVLRYVLTIYSSGTAPDGALSKGLADQVQRLGLAPALPLSEVTMRRKG